MVRFKNRYIVFEIDNGKSINLPLSFDSQVLQNEIVNKVKYIHGIYGFVAVKPGLKVIYCNELTRIAILRVRHGPHRLIVSVLPLILRLKNTNCNFKILYVGATLHHCYKAILSYRRKEFCEVLPELKSDEEIKTKSKVLRLENFIKSDEIKSSGNICIKN